MNGTLLDHLRPRLAALVIVGIGILVIAGVVAGILMLTGEVNDPGTTSSPAALTEAPPLSSPAATASPMATPGDDEPIYAAGTLPAMLAMAPDQIDDDQTGLPIEATWADVATWLSHLGLDPQSARMDEIENAISALELPGVLQTRATSDDWRNIYGFNVRDLHQVLTIGHAPAQVVIMRGDFDTRSLYDTWVRNGYFAVEVEETTIWSLFPGDRIDLTAPASRPALGLFNNLVIVDDTTIVASARQSDMARVLRVIRGADPSLLDHGAIERALETWAPGGYPVTAILADGTLLEVSQATSAPATGQPAGTAEATPLAQAPLPPVSMVILGIVPGMNDNQSATLQAIMIYNDPPDDIDLVPAIVTARGDDDPDWTSRFTIDDSRLVGDDLDMVSVGISGNDLPGSWSQLIENRDLAPLQWLQEP